MAGAVVAVVALVAAACSGADVDRPAGAVVVTAAPPTSAATDASPGATEPGAAIPAPPRVLAVGDSTLLAVERYEAFAAFGGMDLVYDAKSCRTIGIPSCGPRPKPKDVVHTVTDAEGTFDTVVVMAGYDEWYTTFPDSFDAAVAAARAKGAARIVWLTYTDGFGYVAPSGETAHEAFERNNATLREKVASGSFPDVVLADWRAYSAPRSHWFSDDGIHLTLSGAYAVADYISRKVAFLAQRPCPQPRAPGGAVEDPCPDPDLGGPIDDVRSLYP